MIEVLAAASEYYPLIKTGGLADVAGALPAALKPHGVTTRTLVPGYPADHAASWCRADACMILPISSAAMRACSRQAIFSCSMRRISMAATAIPIWDRTARTGRTIGGASRRLASLRLRSARHHRRSISRRSFMRMTGRRPWRRSICVTGGHGEERPHHPQSRLSGPVSIADLRRARPAGQRLAIDGVEYYGAVGFLKGGLASADAITTVSPTYAAEIATPEQGMGLDGLIRARRAVVTGIVNGIDIEIWDPATRRSLVGALRFSPALQATGQQARDRAALRTRARRWSALLRRVAAHLAEGHGHPRRHARRIWSRMARRLALLGSGEAWLEQAFAVGGQRHRGRIGDDRRL